MGGGDFTKKQMLLTILESAVLRAAHLYDGLDCPLCPGNGLCRKPPLPLVQVRQLQQLHTKHATLLTGYRTLAGLRHERGWHHTEVCDCYF